jgi:Molecular chaperone
MDLSNDKMAMQRLKEAAEKAKKDLSTVTSTNINLPFITMNQDGPKHLDVTLTRAKFDEITADLVDSTMGPVKTALSDAGLQASELDKILLVGGSTRIIAVQDAVKKITGKEPFKGINPDECVAVGAAIQGGKMSGEAGAGDIMLVDVTPLSLSIETMGGVATKIVEKNTAIPTNKKQVFSTAADNQTAVDIRVVQGERPLARDNKELGMFRLDGIAPARRGVPQIEVTFDIDANGIVHVSAKDLGTGKEQTITITASTNLSDDEIDKAVREAEEFAEADKKRKEAIDAKNEADSLIFQTEKTINDLEGKIDESEKAAVEAELSKLKSLAEGMNVDTMTEADVATLKEAIEALTQEFYKISEKLYQQNQAQGEAPQDAPNGDVVDGDAKEM